MRMRHFVQLLAILLFFSSVVAREPKKNKVAEENDDVFSEEPMSTKHWVDPDNMAYDNVVHPKSTSSVPV